MMQWKYTSFDFFSSVDFNSLRSFFVIPFFYLHSLFWFTRNFSLLTDLRSSKKKHHRVSLESLYSDMSFVLRIVRYILYIRRCWVAVPCLYMYRSSGNKCVCLYMCARLSCDSTQALFSYLLDSSDEYIYRTIFSTKFISAYIWHLVLMFMHVHFFF